jgi:hypothetical protein
MKKENWLLAMIIVFLLVAFTNAKENIHTVYSDPFAYCAAIGTIDKPDERYAGPKMPDSIVQGMIKEGVISADAPPEFQENAVWRCMDKSVWVCQFGANLPCLEKAITSRVPTSEMEGFCRSNPKAESLLP